MDPDAALRELRAIVAVVLAEPDDIGGEDARADLVRACEVFDGIDGWIGKGGFLPAAWSRVPDAVALVGAVRRALVPCGLTVVPDSGRRWAVVSVADAGAFGVDHIAVTYARGLSAPELARWADGWLACWRVWGGGKG